MCLAYTHTHTHTVVIMDSLCTYQIESTEVCSSGLGRNPDKRIRSSNDHHSRLRTITWIGFC
jgi:hypothetical protein